MATVMLIDGERLNEDELFDKVEFLELVLRDLRDNVRALNIDAIHECLNDIYGTAAQVAEMVGFEF